MKTSYLIVIIAVTISIIVTSLVTFDYYTKEDPDYIKQKIIELERMPCWEMSQNHHHEIEDDEHYSAYDQKFMECFGYIP